MNRHDFAVLTLRGFALYAWFNALEYLSTVLPAIWMQAFINDATPGLSIQRHTPSLLAAFFAPAAVYFVAGIFFFVFSDRLASWLLPEAIVENTDSAAVQTPYPHAGASIAFAAVGVAMFLHELPGVSLLLINIMQSEAGTQRDTVLKYAEPKLIAQGAELLLGFALFLNARTFATAWWRKQTPKGGESLRTPQ